MRARDFLDNNIIEYIPSEEIEKVMIEFAKYHVEQALEAASEKAELDLISNYKRCEISNTSILNAYSLENIK
jgi:hypothetical protein